VEPSELIVKVAAIMIGIFIVTRTIYSAIQTFILPRMAWDPIAAFVFRTSNRLFRLFMRVRRINDYERRDKIMALFPPISLITLPTAWLFLAAVGYMFIYWGMGVSEFRALYILSGSSILTLGFAVTDVPGGALVAFTEAAIGLMLVSILIAYLPTIYSAFSRREVAVAMLSVRAGSPPSVYELYSRFNQLKRAEKLRELWETWEIWFAELDESHTSLVSLVFFRSPQPERSWITAAGAVLDSAAFMAAAYPSDNVAEVEAAVCIRAGYIALRHIADYFGIPYDPNPKPTDPISISREEFMEVYNKLAAEGMPLREAEQAWLDFAGWRVNYDKPLLGLAALTMAPYAPWSSDRSLADSPPRRVRRR
jgi:hypothetical protein